MNIQSIISGAPHENYGWLKRNETRTTPQLHHKYQTANAIIHFRLPKTNSTALATRDMRCHTHHIYIYTPSWKWMCIHLRNAAHLPRFAQVGHHRRTRVIPWPKSTAAPSQFTAFYLPSCAHNLTWLTWIAHPANRTTYILAVLVLAICLPGGSAIDFQLFEDDLRKINITQFRTTMGWICV